ncbi:hypothetical protein SADUNF_Sadunf11G0114400 [Salix dunnii]|uniref:Uncharacterized protein n=1 Tax=Salix dunnii TaxID=1413687 RepID=A0A835JMR9_9ROSI|nr:hypothetical protein SADUNF_Sadunf11G0114400 [Salix dunnii]
MWTDEKNKGRVGAWDFLFTGEKRFWWWVGADGGYSVDGYEICVARREQESNPEEKGDPANKVVKWVMPGSLYATSKEQSPPSQIGCCRFQLYELHRQNQWRIPGVAASLLARKVSHELVIRFPLGYQSVQQKSSRAVL